MSLHILVPRYASPERPHGLIPPSPPAERRAEKRRALARLLRYPISGRVLLPGMPQYAECLQAARIGTPGALTGGMQSLTGVETGLFGSNAPAIPTPTSFYRFEEAAGANNALDSAGSSDLSQVGSPGSTTGKIGTARTFNGSSQYCEAASGTVFQFTDGVSDWTIGGWVFLVTLRDLSNVFTKGASYFVFYWTGFSSTNMSLRCFHSSNAGSSTDVSFPKLTTGAWHLLICTYNHTGGSATAGKATVYVDNGVAGGPQDSYGGWGSDTSKFTFAADSGGGHYENCYLDAWGVWISHTFSSGDANALWNGGAGSEYYSGAWH